MVCLDCSGGSVMLSSSYSKQKKRETGVAEENFSESVEILWRDSSRGPWDYRNTKCIGSQTHSETPDVEHKITKDPQYIYGGCMPCVVQKESTERGPQPMDNTRDREAGVEEAKRRRDVLCRTRQHEEVLIVSNGAHHLKFQDDTGLAVKYVASLKECANQKDLQRGSKLHTDIVRTGLLEKNVFVGSAVVNMYAKCGALDKAQEVFDVLLVRNVVTWNALIAGYAQHEHGKEALQCYKQMRLDDISPNGVTFTCILKACGSVEALDKGQEIHAQILKQCLLEKHIAAANALVDMYAKCGALEKAREVFDELVLRDIVSWNAVIAGCVQHGHGEEALCYFEQMQFEGLSPNAVTFSCILKACGTIGAIDKGEEIHIQIGRERLLGQDIVLDNALIDMYAKCGALEKAQNVFNTLPRQNIVSWTVLIAGYAQYGHGEEAINCFEKMRLKGFSPDVVTFACILKACGSVGASDKGQEIHAQIVGEGFLEEDIVIGCALVDMYVKCGELKKALDVFDGLSVRNVVLWNALMAGYAQLGKDETVLSLFEKMICEGIEPCPVTLIVVLNTCSHKGLLDKGEVYFEIISKGYGITPTLEHHTCMVDLFGRVGCFDKAVAVIERISLSADLVMWLTLLDACQKWGNVDIGKWAFEQALRLDVKDVSAYVCMCNIYAAVGRLEDVSKIEAMRKRNQACKNPGHCW